MNLLPVDDTSVFSEPGSSLPSVQVSKSSDDSVSVNGQDFLPDGMDGVRDGRVPSSGSERTQRKTGQEPVDAEGRTVEWVVQSPFPEPSEVESVGNGGTESAPLIPQNNPEMSEGPTDHSVTSDPRLMTDTDD